MIDVKKLPAQSLLNQNIEDRINVKFIIHLSPGLRQLTGSFQKITGFSKPKRADYARIASHILMKRDFAIHLGNSPRGIRRDPTILAGIAIRAF